MTREEQIFAYKELRKKGQAFFIDTYEDADRIIEALELTKGLSETNTSNPMYEIGYKKGASDMEQAKQIIIDKLLEQIPKWHLVADGDLPAEYDYYLCQLKGTHNYGGNIQVCKYRKADKFKEHDYFHHMRDGFPNVIAWMELPEFKGVE